MAMLNVFPRLVISLLLATAFLARPAAAGDISDALSGFTKDSYGETVAAIHAVAASGDGRAEIILKALQESQLYFTTADHQVYIKTASSQLLVAATGGEHAAGAPFGLKKVKVNNLVRGELEAALGSLTLMSPDRAKRQAAADAVFISRDASA